MESSCTELASTDEFKKLKGARHIEILRPSDGEYEIMDTKSLKKFSVACSPHKERKNWPVCVSDIGDTLLKKILSMAEPGAVAGTRSLKVIPTLI